MNEMRASDADRERVVSAMQEQVGLGRLTLEEFEERSTVAYTAKTVGELRKLTRDLPIEPFPEPVRPFGAPQVAWSSPYYPRTQQGQQVTLRRPNPWLLIPLAFISLMIVGNIVGAVLWGAGVVFPVFILAFVALRLAGLSRRRGH
jgi:hypothetical protein